MSAINLETLSFVSMFPEYIFEQNETVRELSKEFNIEIIIRDDIFAINLPQAIYSSGVIIINSSLVENVHLARAIIWHELGHEGHAERYLSRFPDSSPNEVIIQNYFECEADQWSVLHSGYLGSTKLLNYLMEIFKKFFDNSSICNNRNLRRIRREFSTRIRNLSNNIRIFHERRYVI